MKTNTISLSTTGKNQKSTSNFPETKNHFPDISHAERRLNTITRTYEMPLLSAQQICGNFATLQEITVRAWYQQRPAHFSRK